MDSGIYQITFPNGYFYIGKSETIGQRWKTHQKNFEQGTHTKKMQAAYDEFGQPDYEIILPLHPEHIGIYESIFINRAWNNGILNTTKPKLLDSEDAEAYLDAYDNVTLEGISCMLHSTLQHVTTLREHHHKLNEANLRIEQLETAGIVLPDEIADDIQALTNKVAEYRTELKRLGNLGVYDRMFNYRVYV